MTALRHRAGRLIFGFAVGLAVAFLAYRWVVDPAPRLERIEQEAAVVAARTLLVETLALDTAEIVDPLTADRSVGKAYVYRAEHGWQVSGYYRRGETDLWHPFLMDLDDRLDLLHLKISDGALLERANEPRLEVLP